MSRRLPKVIVGLDPGTTTGLAILSLSGDVLLLKSLRHWSRSSIVLEMFETGTPVLLASDRSEAPRAVKELAQSLSLPVFTVGREGSLEDKSSIISEFAEKKGLRVEDDHQASALYAALKAYNSFKNEFRQIEAEVEKRIVDFKNTLVEEVKSDLVKGIPPEHSLRERLSQARVQSIDPSVVESLRKQLLEERRKVEVLIMRLESLSNELRRLRSEKHARREEASSTLVFTPGGSRVTSLRGLFRKQEEKPYVEVDVFDELTSKKAKSEVSNMVIAARTLKGDLSKIFKALSSRGVKILILDSGNLDEEMVKEAAYYGVLLCDMWSLPLEKADGGFRVRKEDIRSILETRRSILTSSMIRRLTELSGK
ncbi:MAG: DUF460 domain-containing protein [Thermoproteota archaeon]